MGKILVIIDMQTNFINEIGAERIVSGVAAKTVRRIDEGYEILLTIDKSGGSLDGRISNVCKGAKIFNKHSYGCEELTRYLKERNPETVEFMGICTDICVITNVLAAMTALPFSQFVVDGSCCAAETAEGHISAIRVMKSCNIKII